MINYIGGAVWIREIGYDVNSWQILGVINNRRKK